MTAIEERVIAALGRLGEPMEIGGEVIQVIAWPLPPGQAKTYCLPSDVDFGPRPIWAVLLPGGFPVAATDPLTVRGQLTSVRHVQNYIFAGSRVARFVVAW